jgi:three-Cys-motif partner protein
MSEELHPEAVAALVRGLILVFGGLATVMASWVSHETEAKEHDFRGIIGMHALMCRGIATRQQVEPYLYVDCHAGPGLLEYQGRHFDGSPLIAQDVLTQHHPTYTALHFEQDPDTARQLAGALTSTNGLLWNPDPEQTRVRVDQCEHGLPQWLAEQGHQDNRYGLIYADPINKEIPVGMLNQAAHYLPRVDLLAYVGATGYKRRRGVDCNRARLSEHIAGVDKRHRLIRRGRGRQQWTFVLWTNWGDFPEWEQIGFHRVSSPAGQRILDELNLTATEQHARHNQPLWSGAT